MSREALVRYGTISEVARFAIPADFARERGGRVVVRTHRGVELGTLLQDASFLSTQSTNGSGSAVANRDADDLDPSQQFILRPATVEDEQTGARLRSQCEQEYERWKGRIDDWNLRLELIDLEWTLDEAKLILYVLNDRGPESTKLALQAAAAGYGIVEVQPVGPEGPIVQSAGAAAEAGTAVRAIRTAVAARTMDMADDSFCSIENAREASGPGAAIEELLRSLESRGELHRLFDAMLLKKKFEMGLPLSRPTSFDNVPEDRQPEFEEAYIAAARRVGEGFLSQNNIPQAWIYLRTIREPQRIVKALDAIAVDSELPENADELISIALYERAHPVKGLELMLHSRGTCNTITAFDQAVAQISPEDRIRGVLLLVRHLYGELLQSVCRDIERRQSAPCTKKTLREAISGVDGLFDDGNYHIDVSHLAAVVRFARFLPPESEGLPLVMEMCEYGQRLSSQFQFPADPPFDEYYTAHLRFFQILTNDHRDEAIAYFHDRIRAASELEDRRLIAYVLVDLLVRIGAKNDAVAVAKEHLADLDESSGFSFAQLCEEAERMDVYRETARNNGDLVGFTAALLKDANPERV